MAEIQNNSSESFSSIIWYGQLPDFGNVEGFLIDELDYENDSNSNTTYLGNVGPLPVYIRCGEAECDVYYAELLAGRFYVGYLYTLTAEDVQNDSNLPSEVKKAEFCPI